MRRCHLGDVCALLAIVTLGLAAISGMRATRASEPYCGVYSVYIAADVLEHPIEFESLLSNEYVLGWEGSSINALTEAVEDHGLVACKIGALSYWDLRLASFPVILHVRSDISLPRFDHWVVYLGEKAGRARILDPSHGEQVIDYAHLLALWDGAGLAVSDSSGKVVAWRVLGILWRLMVIAVVAVLCCGHVKIMATLWQSQRSGSHRSRVPASCVVGSLTMLMVTAVFLDGVFGPRIWRQSYVTQSIATMILPRQFPRIGTEELRQALFGNDGSELVLVDARLARDYEYRQLPRAISVPVDAAPNQEEQALANISRDAPVVVYCQSSECTFSDVVAQRLYARGFKDIRIYREGVVGWFGRPAQSGPSKNRTSGNGGEDEG
ncbi:MAG: hypothetical protein KatS3mg111_0291 [Pirellulaceae bacterium]|nr:MAG: hypothetical protein KatS3mg111_0291 [Pirellulaceae bacterium]